MEKRMKQVRSRIGTELMEQIAGTVRKAGTETEDCLVSSRRRYGYEILPLGSLGTRPRKGLGWRQPEIVTGDPNF
jgi:hypothetical protein